MFTELHSSTVGTVESGKSVLAEVKPHANPV